ncbi:MAG: DEAD/DEAH box helicase [Candidatus Omnitrophica bacterium]|nr:DEAD/DEAH box helicase [Candidatus Omnitrophota bacterium]
MRIYKNLVLDKFQEEAINAIDNQESILISAPTGAGKTLVAEYAIDSAIAKNKGIIYTAPVKALSNQKYRDFRKLYKDKVGILTGDVSINPGSPIMIMTTEIFRNVILTEPKRLDNKEWIIFDEIHYLDDFERGTVWEESIMLMPRHLKILALSATVPNIDQITLWIRTIHHIPIKVIKEDRRPVPLSFYFQCNDQIFSTLRGLRNSELISENFPKSRRKDQRLFMQLKPNRINTIFKHLKEENLLPCIYFSFSRKRTEIFAQELAMYNFLNPEEKKEITSLYEKLLKTFDLEHEPTSLYLFDLVKNGIAFHHAGLLPTLKEVIERLFTSKLLKAIFTTETFALGINMPARTVIFDDLRKFYGQYHRNIKTRDFYQMAGRAGRRGIDKKGFVFMRINPFNVSKRELKEIIYGESEEIKSQLRSNYATILNLYKDMQEKIYDIYPLSFHYFQSKERKKEDVLNLLKNKILLLKELDYITSDNKLSWKGEFASRMYSYELQIGQLYENGFLESLSEKELAILISSLVYEPRRGQRKPTLGKYTQRMQGLLESTIKQIHKTEKKYRVYPLSKRFYFHLSQLTCLWFDGIEFSKLAQFTDIDEGELVRYLRMNIQVLRELLSFEGVKEDFKKKVKNVLKRINRDVIDAEKQLRQEI